MMKNFTQILFEMDECQRGILTLNRAEKHNAFNEIVIQELIDALDYAASLPDLRCLVLKANGKSFSAGADLDWMKRMAQSDQDTNYKDAMNLAIMLERLHYFPAPTIAIVQGSAYGGGVGLIACCDIVLAHEKAQFALTEVKLGIIAATIMPYVLKAMSPHQAKRFLYLADVFSAETAQNIGLVHELAQDSEFAAKSDYILKQINLGGLQAFRETKKLIFDLESQMDINQIKQETSSRIAERRISQEAKEGFNAFFEKRKPSWVK